MRIIESPLMEVAVTSFRGEAADPERWSVLPKVTQRVSGRSGTQTHASESRTGISATRLGIQWLQGSGVSDQLLPLHSLQPGSHLGHTCWSSFSPAAQTGSCPHVPFPQSWKSKKLSPLQPLEEAWPCPLLDFSPSILMLDARSPE